MQADSKAAELLEQVLLLFTPYAVTHSGSSRAEGPHSASEALLSLFGASSATKPYLSPGHLAAALTVVTPDLHAALPSEDQAALTAVSMLYLDG